MILSKSYKQKLSQYWRFLHVSSRWTNEDLVQRKSGHLTVKSMSSPWQRCCSLERPADSASTWRWLTSSERLFVFIRDCRSNSLPPPSSHQLISRSNMSNIRQYSQRKIAQEAPMKWNLMESSAINEGKSDLVLINIDWWFQEMKCKF